MPQDAADTGRIILKDGTTAELRPATASDEQAFLQFLEAMSSESRSRRFLAALKPDAAARTLVRAVTEDEQMTLVALMGGPDHPRIVATGTYVRNRPGDDCAEIAFVVDDAYHGKGLATLLLERLALVAARHGIRRFYALTQPDNAKMLEVLRQSGFAIQEEDGRDHIVVDLSVLPNRESVTRAELRDRIATVASMQAFFRPRAIAVIGASRQPDNIGRRVLEYLVMNHFNGPVYPVNPRANVVGSICAYPTIGDVPGPVDLAIIAVPAQAVLPVVEACGKKGVRGLVVITAGFAETGDEGRAAQQRVVETARGYGMRIVGPNCLGLMNTSDEVHMNASFSPVFPPRGRVAMSSQSGALGLAILEYARDLGLGLSTFVSVGNKADVSGNDLIQYWEDDPDTDLILLYLESFGNPRRFARLARRVGRKKPILVVKAGRTLAGTRAAGSHTAALAASETAVEALFRQAGVIRADTLEELFDVASLMANQPLPQGPRVAIITNAGGPGILATDALAGAGLEVPEPSAVTQDRLRSFLPSAANLKNPVDMIASAGPEQYRQAVEAVLADRTFDAVLIIFIPVGLADSEGVATAVREAVASARSDGNVNKPVLACFMSTSGLRTPLAVGDEKIPSYRFPESAARALARSYEYALWQRQPAGEIPDAPPPGFAIERARSICRSAYRERGGGWLTVGETADVLDAFGLAVVHGTVVRSADEAVTAAETQGYPAAVKLVSRNLVHKTDWNGVELNLENAEAVRAACGRIAESLERVGKRKELDGFLIQPMVAGGTELVVGVTTDPLFGPLVAFGLGGIHVEILRDVVFRITPLTDRDAEEMVRQIRGYRLLTGYRDRPPADVEALKDTLLRVSRLVGEVSDITELDLNPVKALRPGEGVRILDARIRVGK